MKIKKKLENQCKISNIEEQYFVRINKIQQNMKYIKFNNELNFGCTFKVMVRNYNYKNSIYYKIWGETRSLN